MNRVTKNVEERRQEIIDTAKLLFLDKGFKQTQISDIAEHMHVAQGLVYHYFKSKKMLLCVVIEEIAKERELELEHSLSEFHGTSLEKLDYLLQLKKETKGIGELIGGIEDDLAIISYCRLIVATLATPAFVKLITEGNADGSWNCRYPEETAVFLFKALSGDTEFEKDDNETARRKAEINTYFVHRVLGLDE